MNNDSHNGPENTISSLEKSVGKSKVALIFHIKITDHEAYKKWLNVSGNYADARRLYRVKVDPAPWEGIEIDEIIIVECTDFKSAKQFMSIYNEELKNVCSVLIVLAIVPEPQITFRIVKAISWLVKLFIGAKDSGVPSSKWKAKNIAVWPSDYQMHVARNQNMDKPLFVYNLNENKVVANYQTPATGGKQISGQEAYDRYSKIAGFELLRRGAFPVYGGKPICLLEGSTNCSLAGKWDKFIFVRYPQRKTLLAILESDEFNKAQSHRDAGLERVAIFMANEA